MPALQSLLLQHRRSILHCTGHYNCLCSITLTLYKTIYCTLYIRINGFLSNNKVSIVKIYRQIKLQTILKKICCTSEVRVSSIISFIFKNLVCGYIFSSFFPFTVTKRDLIKTLLSELLFYYQNCELI